MLCVYLWCVLLQSFAKRKRNKKASLTVLFFLLYSTSGNLLINSSMQA